MPDVEGSLGEIEYALDTLKADGIGLMTSIAGKYLGEPTFDPVYNELNRRKAVVYTHPLTPDCCRNLVPGTPPGTIEYATDTTRTVASILFSGTAAKFPNIRFIFSHSGGTLPFLAGRFERQAATQKYPFLPDGVMPELKKFYYDVAQGNTAAQLAALTRLAPISQLLFGTDYPFRPGSEAVQGLRNFGFGDADMQRSSVAMRLRWCRASGLDLVTSLLSCSARSIVHDRMFASAKPCVSRRLQKISAGGLDLCH